MAYKTFVAGEEALASDVNSYLMSQTVARFANAAARTAALTAPVLNQMSAVDTSKSVPDIYDGAAWKPLGVTYERFWSGNGPAIMGAVQNDYTITTFTMPITGVILLSGIANFIPAAGQPASPISASVIASASSIPSPAVSAPSNLVLNANGYQATLPFHAKWNPVTAGTAVTIRGGMVTSAGQVTFNWWMGTLRLIPLEF